MLNKRIYEIKGITRATDSLLCSIWENVDPDEYDRLNFIHKDGVIFDTSNQVAEAIDKFTYEARLDIGYYDAWGVVIVRASNVAGTYREEQHFVVPRYGYDVPEEMWANINSDIELRLAQSGASWQLETV